MTGLQALLLAAISSGALGAFVTALFGRKRVHAEAMDISLKAALALEDRATLRATAAQTALDVAQTALDAARNEIRLLEDEVDELHEILDKAGIKYPQRQSQPQV